MVISLRSGAVPVVLRGSSRSPEVVEVGAARRVERVHLARRALLGWHLLDVDEAALLDAHEEGVDRALGDVGEALVAQPRGDLVAVGGAAGEDRQHDAFEGAFEHLGDLLGHGASCYSVSLTTGR